MATQNCRDNGPRQSISRANYKLQNAVPYAHHFPYLPPSHPPPNHAFFSRAEALERPPEADSGANQRRRIQVACSRCRRRKIKCSGDPGDGTGCIACHAANADPKSCVFTRVGTLKLDSLDMLCPSPTSTNIPTLARGGSLQGPMTVRALNQRPPPTVLHTQSTVPTVYETANPPSAGFDPMSNLALSRPQPLMSTYHTGSDVRSWTPGLASVALPPGGPSHRPRTTTSDICLHPSTSLNSVELPTGSVASLTDDGGSIHSRTAFISYSPTDKAPERHLPLPSNQVAYLPTTATTEVPTVQRWAPFPGPNSPSYARVVSERAYQWPVENRVSAGGSRANMSGDSVYHLPSSLAQELNEDVLLGYQYAVPVEESESSASSSRLDLPGIDSIANEVTLAPSIIGSQIPYQGHGRPRFTPQVPSNDDTGSYPPFNPEAIDASSDHHRFRRDSAESPVDLTSQPAFVSGPTHYTEQDSGATEPRHHPSVDQEPNRTSRRTSNSSKSLEK